MSFSSNLISQKDYLKKYLSGDVKDGKRKKKSLISSSVKRSTIIDDDIDLKSMRPLDDDEVDLFQMDEDAPLIAGIIDERPEEVKAQEYYNSKRWKVFGGDDGVNVVDTMDSKQSVVDKLNLHKSDFDLNQTKLFEEKTTHRSGSIDSGNLPIRNRNDGLGSSRNRDSHYKTIKKSMGAEAQKKIKSSHHDDSDLSPRRNDKQPRERYSSDPSPPRRDHLSKYSKDQSDSDVSLPRSKSTQKREKQDISFPIEKGNRKRENYKSDSDYSPPRKEKGNKSRYERDSDNSPPRKEKGNRSDYDRADKLPSRQGRGGGSYYRRDCDNSPPRDKKESFHRHKSDSDNFLPRVKKRSERSDRPHSNYNESTNKEFSKRLGGSSDSDNSPPRKDKKNFMYGRQNSLSIVTSSKSPPEKSFSLSNLPNSSKSNKRVSPKLARRDVMYKKNAKRNYSDSDDSPHRRRKNSFCNNESSPDLSPPRKRSEKKPQKKKLYKPNDSSSSEEASRSKSQKMKTTLDGKQAGLQDAKELRKELSDLRMKEDLMFSKMDASVSGVGAAAIKRDRKTGQIRDMEKEKEIQKEKEAKASIVSEKYSRWGKGLKQVEDAKERAADALKEMNKPLARYVDDEDLDNFLKAQEREGDPMLDYIKQRQKEATPLVGEKPKYQGPCNPNRFGIRPGHRWDGVVRSSGFEKEWFTHQNARKARDEEAYKWSTSDM